MEFLVTKSDYFSRMLFRPEEQGLITCVGMSKVMQLAALGVSITLYHDGLILGIMGVYELWPGVHEVWMLPSQLVTEYSFVYLRSVKRYIISFLKSHNAHRLQTTAITNLLHDRWMTFLGFEKEGILKAYGPAPDRQDYAMWSLVYGQSA